MPELPDLELYLAALRPRLDGARFLHAAIIGPSFLRTVDPPIDALEGEAVVGIERLGKRIVVALEGDRYLAIHLMIAGRLRWESAPGPEQSQTTETGASLAPRPRRSRFPDRSTQAVLVFDSGHLRLVESGTRKRATLHVLDGRTGLALLDRGGVEPLQCSLETFTTLVRRHNRTLKRMLTDPATLSGIGNAYSDEILHRARLSPVQLTSRLDDGAISRLHGAMQTVLAEWTDRLQRQLGNRFPGPGEVTAFRPEMAVHGRFGQPCPDCGTLVQRIVKAENEVNYCPRCQTGGKVLADRSLSRLLKDDWPDRIEDWEGER